MLKLFPDRVITLRGAAILTVALLVGCGDDPPPEGLAALDPLVPTTTTVVQSAEEIELIERAGRDIADSISMLLEAEFVTIRYGGRGEASTIVGTVDHDLSTGDFHSTEVETHTTGTVVSSEHILIGDELFVRFHHGDGQLEDIEFTPVTPGSLRDEFVDESLTMAGRAGASLDRIIRYLEDVEFDVAEIEPRIIDGRRQIGYEVAFDGAAISSFLRDEQLERVGPSSPDGSTVYEFWIDEAGHLARLKLEGVHFEDGEALHGFSGELLYTLKDATEIVRP